MGQVSKFLRSVEGGRLAYWCQGCEMAHQVGIAPPAPKVWNWNGDVERPTFTPSVLVTYDHLSVAAQARHAALREQLGRDPTHDEVPYDVHDVCHTFITNGVVQFLGDCTHALAGQTLPLPELPDWLKDD